MSKLYSSDILKIELGPELHKQLKNHVLEVKRKEEDIMRQKLQRDMDKIARVRDIENKFVEWVERKNQESQAKIDKVEKNKEDHINKIVKKCKDRDKFLTKKQEDFKIAKKKNLNMAWKKAEKFNDDIQNYYKSKRFMTRTAKASVSGAQLHQDQGRNTVQVCQQDKQKLDSLKVANSSKIYASNNTYDKIENKMINTPNYRQTKYQKFVRTHSSNLNDSSDGKNSLQILEKVKEFKMKIQRDRIQELGEKMQRIQKSRARRLKKHQRKTTKQESPDMSRGRNLSSLDQGRHQNKKKAFQSLKKDGVTRLHSQQFYRKQNRIKDRSEDYRMKRNEMFQQHLIDGYEYLQNLKVRHLKTVIAKNISYNAMQKKLYMERFMN